ncbi:ABC transporter ATP-binding protein [Variovorax sp. J22R133]|uniref:ABC transporter ATP-binding protein n=1 Tax=Variovorax brevis TaxID=3053503 RepID=UPI0025752F4A|nr:ABC transporter ATP-binding protein [Variovorax sp. J22R133]MDM0111713.1 ABC transporter ATP-binding protein [Variovorax sp. J22R133]
MTQHLLEAKNLTVRFGGLTAVDAVNATLDAGELVGIIGPNGAGKTTFFNAVSGVIPPTSGQLIVAGDDLTGRSPHHFAAHGIARTFQTPRVFADMSVMDNVRFGMQFAGRHRAAPKGLSSEHHILAMLGLDALAAQRAGDITPSQQRLLEIGMALGTRPRVLLLDEVAAGLTETEVDAMAKRIRRLRDEWQLSVIWIEHAVGTLLRYVERVMVLHQGRKIADGTPRDVVRNAEVIEAYLGDEIAAGTVV